MTPEQAIQILDRALRPVALSRDAHLQILEALKVLTEAVKN